MGTTRVDVTVMNPVDRARRWTAPFVVDTGAMVTVVPQSVLRRIGVAPERRETFTMADGRKVECGVGIANVELLGKDHPAAGHVRRGRRRAAAGLHRARIRPPHRGPGGPRPPRPEAPTGVTAP